MIGIPTDRLDPVSLRPAAAADCERVWQWNFDPAVRAQSRTKAAVSLASHAAWFAKRLHDDRGPMWIVEEHFRAVGVVRIDAGDTAGRLSIALGGDARGRGIGKRAIRAACAAWKRPVVAEVMTDNVASRACFEACGFHPTAEHDGVVLYRWEQ